MSTTQLLHGLLLRLVAAFLGMCKAFPRLRTASNEHWGERSENKATNPSTAIAMEVPGTNLLIVILSNCT